MGLIVNNLDWETTFRKQVRKLREGWNVRKSSKTNKVSLVVREKHKPSQETVLPFKWTEDDTGNAYARIRNIYALMLDGELTLKQAAKLAESDAPKLVEKLNWQEAMDNFKIYKTKFENTIKESVWKHDYEPVLTEAVKYLTSNKPPATPAKLIDKCVIKYKAGVETRKRRVNTLFAFLEHCFKRESFPPSWLPKTERSEHIGTKAADWESDKKDAATDQEIIDLVNGFTGDTMLQDCLKLIAELGLRPIELKHLSVKYDEFKQPYWWCSYRKKSSKGTTDPRHIDPLELVDDDGNVQKWNLIDRWQLGDIKLPLLDGKGGVAGDLRDQCRSRPAWKNLYSTFTKRGEKFGLYSLRHGYSVRGTSRNIDSGSMSDSMGNRERTFLDSYQSSSKKTRRTAFAQAAKLLEDKQ